MRFDFDTLYMGQESPTLRQGLPWDDVKCNEFTHRLNGDAITFTGLDFTMHNATIEAYMEAMANTDVVTYFHSVENGGWGRRRRFHNVYRHPDWYINPLLPVDTQCYIFRLKLQQFHARMFDPADQSPIVDAVMEFQKRMARIETIQANHVAALRELNWEPHIISRLVGKADYPEVQLDA